MTTISVLTRVRHKELYERMKQSAEENAFSGVDFAVESDNGQPRLAESYNRMVAACPSDIVVFAHDDAVFLTPGWDERLRDLLSSPDINVVGVVGAKNYKGGTAFWGGYPDCVGKYVTQKEGLSRVKLFSGHTGIVPVSVVDSFFFAARRQDVYARMFDQSFDGLFFYDLDLMLRLGKVIVADILMGHYKPANLYGSYPVDMRPMSDYWDYFHMKHSLKPGKFAKEQRCASVSLQDYALLGPSALYAKFESEFMVKK